MKIVLLKGLPGADKGHIFSRLDYSIHDGHTYIYLCGGKLNVRELISYGWAEEIK